MLKAPPSILVQKVLVLRHFHMILMALTSLLFNRGHNNDHPGFWFFGVFFWSQATKGNSAFCYSKLIRIISSHFCIIAPTAMLLMKAVKSHSIRSRIKYDVWITSLLHSYIIAHSVCDLKHANLALSPQHTTANTNLIITAPVTIPSVALHTQ